jgi:hypothetical protein
MGSDSEQGPVTCWVLTGVMEGRKEGRVILYCVGGRKDGRQFEALPWYLNLMLIWELLKLPMGRVCKG